MKKVFFVVLSMTLIDGVVLGDQKIGREPVGGDIVLESPMIDILDGKSFAINGEVFGLMLQVRREMRKLLFGITTKSGRRLGMYRFEGKTHSVLDLAQIEQEIEDQYMEEKSNLLGNKDAYTIDEWNAKLALIEEMYAVKIEQLMEVLEEAKADFIEMTKSYVEGVRGTKEQLLILIKESCEKRGLEECFILKWGETVEGSETDALQNDVTTFREFAMFCYDLANFIEDLARSCPKGKQQFIELVKSIKKK